jgi:hypothetical protein
MSDERVNVGELQNNQFVYVITIFAFVITILMEYMTGTFS